MILEKSFAINNNKNCYPRVFIDGNGTDEDNLLTLVIVTESVNFTLWITPDLLEDCIPLLQEVQDAIAARKIETSA